MLFSKAFFRSLFRSKNPLQFETLTNQDAEFFCEQLEARTNFIESVGEIVSVKFSESFNEGHSVLTALICWREN